MRFQYTVSFKEPQTKYFHITLSITGIDDAEIHLKFPAWIPGSYKIRDFAKDLSHVTVETPAGETLPWRKLTKDEWVIEARGHRSINVSYRIYGSDTSVHGAYLDHRCALWNGPALFFYADAIMAEPVTVDIKAPRGWSIVTGLPALSKTRFQAADIDELYDCPVLASASHALHTFTVARKPHRVAILGEALKPHPELVRDIKKIVETEVRLFGDAPYKNYTFLIHFMPGQYGGLEHRNSSMNIFDGFLLSDKERYPEFLALISHEFFHTWNVKRIRPQALGPFDYSKENYTTELWMAEGWTSFYDDHFLVRAGLMTPETYLEKVVTKTIERYESLPSKSLMSMVESSFDAWIKLYQAGENTPNTIMSYYLKGGLVGMLLDMELIRRTGGKKTLDDVMKVLWRSYQTSGEGFSRADLEEVLVKISGDEEIVRFLRHYVDGTKSIAWKSYFDAFGWELVPKAKDKLSLYMGIQPVERNGGLFIDRVFEGSPAYASDLQPGDEVLAIDGIRVSKEKLLKDLVSVRKAGISVEILYARRGHVGRTSLSLAAPSGFNYDVKAVAKPTAAQKRLFNRFFRKSKR